MISFATVASVLSLAVSVYADSWGGAVSLGPSTTNIVEAVTTIVPGVAPSTQNGELFLWPGMSNGTGDLIQTTLESWPDNSWCGAVTGQWCVRASVFGSFGQISGDAAPVSATDAVTILYTIGSDNTTWTQTVTLNGSVVSTLETNAGPYMKGWGTGTECDSNCSGTVAIQTYTNTKITLDSPDPSFGDTIATSQGASYTGLASSEDGLIWTIEKITIPAMV